MTADDAALAVANAVDALAPAEDGGCWWRMLWPVPPGCCVGWSCWPWPAMLLLLLLLAAAAQATPVGEAPLVAALEAGCGLAVGSGDGSSCCRRRLQLECCCGRTTW